MAITPYGKPVVAATKAAVVVAAPAVAAPVAAKASLLSRIAAFTIKPIVNHPYIAAVSVIALAVAGFFAHSYGIFRLARQYAQLGWFTLTSNEAGVKRINDEMAADAKVAAAPATGTSTSAPGTQAPAETNTSVTPGLDTAKKNKGNTEENAVNNTAQNTSAPTLGL